MKAWNKSAQITTILVSIAIVAFGAFFAVSTYFISLIITAILAVCFYYWKMGKYYRRLDVKDQPFPDKWRTQLSYFDSFYNKLSDEEKVKYEKDIQYFLSDNKITGVNVTIDDRIKLMVAASAVTLIFHLDNWEYPDISEILIYPGAYDDGYNIGGNSSYAGEVHSGDLVILSLPDLRRGFKKDSDGNNVGYHEFAHLLDLVGSSADGVPTAMSLEQTLPWMKIAQKEFEKVQKGKSLLRKYAAHNTAEFFAVAVEYYFEKSKQLKKKHPELYQALDEFFNPPHSDSN